MNNQPNLVGQPTEVLMTIQVTRSSTGKVDEYILQGIIPAQEEEEETNIIEGDEECQ